MEKVCKTTAKIPKSRSKYLMQFLKEKRDRSSTSSQSHLDNNKNYTEVYSKVSRTSKKNQRKELNYDQDYKPDVEMAEEGEELKYKTPTHFGTRRRVKKIQHYEEYHNYCHSSPHKYGIESTAYSNGTTGSHIINFSKTKKNRSPFNSSVEKVHQIHEGDESVEDIEEDEEWDSIPSEDQARPEINNEFYKKIKQASHHDSSPNGSHYVCPMPICKDGLANQTRNQLDCTEFSNIPCLSREKLDKIFPSSVHHKDLYQNYNKKTDDVKSYLNSYKTYVKLLDQESCVNKMVDDILNNETLKISDQLEHIWHEELKETKIDDWKTKYPHSTKKKWRGSMVQWSNNDEITLKPSFQVYNSISPANRKHSKTTYNPKVPK